jgi:hypothetical protein
MSKRREGMTVKACGCVTYEYGPPLKCEKHERKEQENVERGLRKVVRDEAINRGHELTLFSEYESYPGKWTAFCNLCGRIVIVYDAPPERGDQINGKMIVEKECPKS